MRDVLPGLPEPVRASPLLTRALTHRSVSQEHYERLEFVGDAILGFLIAEHLYTHLPAADEGALSRTRAALVCKRTLATIAEEQGIVPCIRVAVPEIAYRASVRADVVESLLGCSYLVCGMDAARRLVDRVYAERLRDLSPHAQHKDPKTRLQDWAQRRKRPLPHYEVVCIHGPEHTPVFEVACRVDGLPAPTLGTGPSRREAEKAAARQALRLLRVDTT
ncbi:MAG: ribonuclease III [Chromatiales bacterium 21-64-14]|nr:MAG: ribonuclease III [Chromatiales bacterium 21-64-14]HQU15461.1 ribonuclease III [Gammaproteobacteria bacterium]